MSGGSDPTVLFVCVHNAGRSQLAAALLDRLSEGQVSALSAGSVPADQLHPVVLEAAAERGLDLSAARPTLLTTGAVQAADVVITMGCGEVCPVFPGKRYLDWPVLDPAGQPLEQVRRIRVDIEQRVRALLAELIGGSTVRELRKADWPAVARIYAAGIGAGGASFETTVPDWPDWDAARLPAPRLVAEVDGAVVGFAALSAYSQRHAYTGVADVTIFVDPDVHGRGIGSALLAALVTGSEAAGLWTLQAGIFPENKPSLALHAKHGFALVGRRHRIGQLGGVWRDVLLLERRSKVIGI